MLGLAVVLSTRSSLSWLVREASVVAEGSR